MTSAMLSAAATVCAGPDPTAIADRLAALPTEEVGACSRHAGALAVALFQGSHATQDAAVATGAAWSTGTSAVTAIGQTGLAGMAARSVMTTLSGALDGARATMLQLQSLARTMVVDAEAALQRVGFDPATGRAASAPVTQLPFPLSSPTGTSVDGTREVIAPILTAAHERLRGLESRLDAALLDLVLVLRTDPRDLLQRLPPLPAAAPVDSPGLADAGAAAASTLTDAVAGTVGALGAAVGGLLAGGAAGAAARAGLAVTDAVRSAATNAAAAVSDRLATVGQTLAAAAAPVPSTAPQADADNRARLTADLRSTDPNRQQRAVSIQAALDDAAAAGETAQLLAYSPATPTSQGTAAISIGDMSTADSVTTMVPGIRNSPDDMSGALDEAARLKSETHRQSPGESTAVVAWFGYDIPATNGYTPDPARNMGSALDDEAAIAGAAALKSDLSRFRAYAPETARQVVIGHSMGSVLVSAAAAQGAVIDDLVLLGSPGASRLADSTHDYPNVAPGHTWVLSGDDLVTRPETDAFAASMDALAKARKATSLSIQDKIDLVTDYHRDPLGSQFGPDPAASDFQAEVIDATGARPEHSFGEWMGLTGVARMPLLPQLATAALANEVDDFFNHPQGNYLSGTALTSIASIAVGHTARVPTKPGR